MTDGWAWFRRGGAALLAVASLGAAEPPQRQTALLIGVGAYPDLPERLRLNASLGDVRRLHGALVGAGVDPGRIRVMTEFEGDERPTRAAILRALETMALEARPGDRVMVYFSGHGTQAPARRPGREPDGLEELFLAADAAGWDGAQGTVRGAIADFELEEAVAAIRARGADVWFVADACHAAGVTRSGAAEDATVKSVSLAELGGPSGAALRSGGVDEVPLRSGPQAGDFTAFYAAAPGSLAVERRLPLGSTRAQPASVFTFALIRALHQGRFRSFRDLAAGVRAAAVDTGAAGPLPVFEGALNAAPFERPPAARSWPVVRATEGWAIEAGAVEGMAEGQRLTIANAPGDPPFAMNATVERVDIAFAVIRPAGPLPPGRFYASLDVQPLDQSRGAALLRALAETADAGPARALEVEAALWRGGCGPNPPAGAGPPQGTSTPFSLAAPPPLKHCDVLYLAVRNAGAAPLDVSPLYLDAAGGVGALGLAPSDDVRLAPGETRRLAVRFLTRDRDGRPLPTGTERLVLVAAEAGPARLDLRSLADAEVRRGASGRFDPARRKVGALIWPLRVED